MELASLRMSVASLQSQMSDYALRARQAEQMFNMLQNDAPWAAISQLLIEQMDQRSSERSVHQQNLIQNTVTLLTTALSYDDAQVRATVVKVVQGLTRALTTIHDVDAQVHKERAAQAFAQRVSQESSPQ